MLKSLSGKSHQVISSLSVILERDGKKKEYLTNSITDVKFINLTDEMIGDYISTGEPMDKAGAYAIQGRASIFVEKINGSYSSVIGLPTHLLLDILKQPRCMSWILWQKLLMLLLALHSVLIQDCLLLMKKVAVNLIVLSNEKIVAWLVMINGKLKRIPHKKL
jgi:hypothetical protein